MQVCIDLIAFCLAAFGIIVTCFNLPGSILVIAGVLLSAWYGEFSIITLPWIVFFCLATLAALTVDNVAMMLGAKRFGASKWGIIGAFIGGLALTILMGPIGVLVGPFVGAMAFEWVFEKKVLHAAARAGFGSLIGTILGIAGKLFITVLMTSVWLFLILRYYFSS